MVIENGTGISKEEIENRISRARESMRIRGTEILIVIGRSFYDRMGQRGIPMPPGILIRNRPTHQELAGMAGMTRETVCRVLRALQREGYLSYRGREITILREQDLRRDFLDELPMSGDGSDQALDHVMVNAV